MCHMLVVVFIGFPLIFYASILYEKIFGINHDDDWVIFAAFIIGAIIATLYISSEFFNC